MDKFRDFDWNHVRAFLETAQEGSLSAAARRLGQSQPTLSRQVAALEADLGVLLFERIGRSLELTQAGLELLEHTRAMGEAANRIALAASGQAQSVEGRVRITASDILSAYDLPEALREIRGQAPLLEIEVIAANDIRDLMRREADIAIRHVRPEQPDLIARLVGEANARLYAASAYLDRVGRPAGKPELSDLDFIAIGDPARMMEFMAPLDIHLRHRNFRLETQNGVVAWEYVRNGFGVMAMSDSVAEKFPEVEPVLPPMDPIRFPVWLTTHRELHTSRRIRLVFDLLGEFLATKNAPPVT